MKLIVAVDREWGIGYKGDLLARIKNDLRNFQSLTKGKTVVLGSNTLATFPGGRALKNRTNIVLNWDTNYAPENVIVVHSLDELFEELKKYNTDDVFVIGGASVYRQLLPYCDTAYVTKFEKSFDKDVWFEDLDKSDEWTLEETSETLLSDPETDTCKDLPYNFNTYRRIKK